MAFSPQLLVVLFGLFIYNFYYINYNKWDKVFGGIIFILLFVPVEIVGLLSGVPYSQAGCFNISLLAYDVLIIMVCIFLLHRNIRNISTHNLISIVACLFFVIGLRFIIDGTEAVSNKMLDNYALPIVLAILFISFVTIDDLGTILKLFYRFVFVNACIACIEYFMGRSLLFHEYYMQTVDWYKTIYISTLYGVAFRCTAFLGHPLTNGTYYLLAIVYFYNKKSEKKLISHFFEWLVLVFAIFTTNSRVDYLIFGVYTIYIFLKQREYIRVIGLLFVAVILICFTDISAVMTKLFIRDFKGTSMMVRINAIKSILSIPLKTFLFGTGYNNTFELLELLKFKTNFEIAYLIILVENGILSFFVWIRGMSLIYKRKMATNISGINCRQTINGMLFCMLIAAAGSNSIGDPGTSNYILWILLACSCVAARGKRDVIVLPQELH